MSTPFTKRRTYTREQWDAAQAAWAGGEYRIEFWREWRRLAGEAGIIAAPTGTRWDSWDDEQPSERALISQAIDESPSLLRSILRSGRCHSWAQVVREYVRFRAGRAEEAERAEEEWSIRKTEPWAPIKSIAQTIMDSLDRQARP